MISVFALRQGIISKVYDEKLSGGIEPASEYEAIEFTTVQSADKQTSTATCDI
jgi:hypothetical protein